LEAKCENTFLIFQEWYPFSNEIEEEMQRKEKELQKYIHKYQLLWEIEITDLRVTEYHYLPFDRGEGD